jgi:hypothetical protein
MSTSQEQIPLSEILDEALIESKILNLGLKFRRRVFTPTVTLWLFVFQVLAGDHSCQNAVNHFLAWLSGKRKKWVSTSTGAYVQARQRLPLALLQSLARAIAGKLHRDTQSQDKWTFKGKSVKLVDGTTLSLPDTSENKKRYRKRKTSYGFPIMRMVGIISFSTGALLDLATASYIGKGTGETTLFIKILQESTAIEPGDILLMDRLYCSYFIVALCVLKKIDLVIRAAATMKTENFKVVRKLGKDDWLLEFKQPKISKSSPVDRKLLRALPKALAIREITHQVKIRGFRPKKIKLFTTFLDSKVYKKEELVDLYYDRWNCELDLRNIKSVLGLNQLSCKTPLMLEKEIWAYALAYNVVRTAMAQAALLAKIKPRDLSFKGSLQTMNNFRPILEMTETHRQWRSLYEIMLQLISLQQILKRPGRIEPRAVRQRSLPYMQLKVPRTQARKLYWKRGDITIKRNKDLASRA